MAVGVCKITKDLTGKIIIITGANTGLGKETTRALARMGATIILACRDTVKGAAVLDEIRKDTKNSNLQVLKLDLSDLQSIANFATEFKSKYTRLDILINNAGVMALPKRQTTKDGFEMQLGTNYLGPFYLTTLLLDVLKKSAPSRVVNVSSDLYKSGKIHWDDLMMEKKYDLFGPYNQSKLALNLFTKELQRKVEHDNIKVVSLHPGVIKTELLRNMNPGCISWFFRKAIGLMGKTVEQGIQTTLQCALEDHDKLVGGAYYNNCKVNKETKAACDTEAGVRLWDLSEKLISGKANSQRK